MSANQLADFLVVLDGVYNDGQDDDDESEDDDNAGTSFSQLFADGWDVFNSDSFRAAYEEEL